MFQGSIVAIVTPMSSEGAVDYESLRRLVEFHIEQKTDAIVAVGTTGESPTLTTEEHGEVIRVVIEQSRGRVPVIAGTGSNSTQEAIGLTRHAHQVRADACLLVTPYYNKPTQEGLYRHFRACAEAVPIPQILYNVPGRTGVDLLPETVARLSQVSNIIGIKEATGKLERVSDILERCQDGFLVFSGDDATAREAIFLGAKGDISVTANVAPRRMHEMCKLALVGDREGAASVDDALAPLHRHLFVEANPIPVKWALHKLGLIPPGIRLPLTLLSEKHHSLLYEALLFAKLL